MYLDVTMEMKSEADNNDITECSRDDKPCVSMFVVFLMLYSLQSFLCVSFSCFPVVLMCSLYVLHQHITLYSHRGFDFSGSYFCVFSNDCQSDCHLYDVGVVSMCTMCIVLCSVYYTVSCFEVKIEADSDDITKCPRGDKPFTGMFHSWYKLKFFVYTFINMKCSFAVFAT